MFPRRIGRAAAALGVGALAGRSIYAHSFTIEGEDLAFDLTPDLDHTELLPYPSPPRIASDMFASITPLTTWDSSESRLST